MSQYRLYFDEDEDSQFIPQASGSKFVTSLPNSPIRSSLTVADRVLSYERLKRKSSAIPKMSLHKQEYDPLKRTRTSLKGWVTRHCNDALQSKTDRILTKNSLRSNEYSKNEFIKKLEEN